MSKKKQKSMEELLEEALVPEEEQPYKVPENWVWVKLTTGFAECLDKYRKPVNAAEREKRKGNIPYYGATGQVGWIDDYLTDDELVLVGEDGAPFFDPFKNKAYMIRGKAWVNNHAHILKSYYGTYGNQYLLHYLNQFNYYGYVSGSTRLKLTQKKLSEIPIPLPPLNEQKRIAEKIKRLFAKIDEAKRLIEEVKESFELRKISIIKKIIDEGKEDAQQRGWKFDAIKNIFEIKGGGTPSKSNKSYWNGTIPWISAKDMKTLYIQETKDYITEEGLNNSSAKIVNKGSIAMVVRSGILQHSLPVAYLMTDCTVNQDLKVFNSGDELVNKYFLWYVKAYEKYLLNEYSKAGTTVNSIEFEKFKSHFISIPPREEIEKKITKIESIVNKEHDIKMYVDQILQLENLKQAILHKAFRGELGTNDPADEHAIELLKEVLKSK